MTLDILQPVKYYLEKSVVNKVIPDASGVPNRKKIKDHPIQEGEKTFDHAKLNGVLQRYVETNVQLGDIENVSVVDYDGLAEDSDFKDYLDLLDTANPDELPPREQLAFWINAYNSLCINLIVSHSDGEPLKSINDLSQPNNPVWDHVAGKVGGRDISLNEIEHEKLRKQWDEPMIHACIVCASASCPNLRNEAFTSVRIVEQMEDQMRDWLSNITKGLSLRGNRLELSRIFLWFEKDFGGWKGLREWIPQFISDVKVAEKISGGRVTLRYLGYDWSINRSPDRKAPDNGQRFSVYAA